MQIWVNLEEIRIQFMLQESIARFLLQRKKPSTSSKGYGGWKSVRTILIVGILDDNWNIKSWEALYALLNSKEKKVEVLLFDPKLEDNTAHHPTFKIFGKKALNLFGQPKGDWIRPYLSAEYNILFCLAEQPNLTIQYICSRIIADCRVGTFDDSYSLFDLVLFRPESMKPMNYGSEMLRYLQQINAA